LLFNFFRVFHESDRKPELFDFAQKPVQIHGLPLQYAVHFLAYDAHEQLPPAVRAFWKELASYRPLPGGPVLAAFRLVALRRFLVRKVVAFDMLRIWFEDEDGCLLHLVLLFLFWITPEDAAALSAVASARFRVVIEEIEGGEKPTQKMIFAIQSAAPKRPWLVLDEEAESMELEEPDESFIGRVQ
jgi:hypothetical protein